MFGNNIAFLLKQWIDYNYRLIKAVSKLKFFKTL